MRFLLLGLSVIFFCALAFLLLSYIPSLAEENVDSESMKAGNATLYFQPKIVSICDNASNSARIFLDTESPVSTAQLELKYDPAIIYNISVAPAAQNLFGEASGYEVVLNEVRHEYGRISFVIHTLQTQESGNAGIAEITFNTYPQAASSSTQISFLNKSTVLANSSKESLLQEAIPLTLSCQK